MMTSCLWNVGLFLGILAQYATAIVLVNGGWSPWSTILDSCTVECGGGTTNYYRSCTNPKPEGGGLECMKKDNNRDIFEIRVYSCNAQPCFNDTWSDWEWCENCTLGEKYREAMCGNFTCDEDGTQYEKETKPCNLWDIVNCPSPCEEKECPDYANCKDISTEKKPLTKCVCTMGYVMDREKKNCVRPPPTTPSPRPIPTLQAAAKTVATGMSKTASVVLIIFVSITLCLFLVLRIFTPDRIIQMNMEIALLLAHIFLLFPPSTVDSPILCKIISMLIHYCFTACFMFMMLEAFHMYFLVAYIVKKDGAFSKIQNMTIGWGVPAIILMFCICFEYDNYGAPYHCWAQLDKPLVYGIFIPIIVIVIITFTLIEAAGASNYKPLDEFDEKQRQSAKISQRTNLIIIPFMLAHWIVGMLSEYEQNLPLYGTFSVLNGITGFVVFFFHCSNNQQVREKITSVCKKATKK